MASVATSTITGRLTDALYTEAMLLADELRAYLDGPAADLRAAMSPQARVLFACESLNATTRVMQLTARLLARRAGAPDGPLEPSTAPAAEALALLPEEARRLIGIGLDLYDRVRRLDGGSRPAEASSPARLLQRRLERVF